MMHVFEKIFTSNIVLNQTKKKHLPENPGDDKTIAKDLNRTILGLYGAHLNEEGTKVDYNAIGKSEKFKQFQEQTKLLVYVDLGKFDNDERKALFLNLYNTCLIHGYVSDGVPGNMITKMKFFAEASYQIGPHIYSLNDMEHGILRANAKNPTTNAHQFDKSDPRLNFICKLDPRIHFALVCGAKSCPAIRIFTPENLEMALDGAAKNFCNNNIELEDKEKKLKISKIFEWYMDDFGGSIEKVFQIIEPFLDDEKKKLIKDSSLKVGFAEYDWSLNN